MDQRTTITVPRRVDTRPSSSFGSRTNSRAEYNALNDALHIRGYLTHEDFFPGRWHAQDMYAVLNPNSPSFMERCLNVSLEEGVFL